MSRILLTGFEAFLGEKINPSKKILEAMDSSEFKKKYQIETCLLPVVYHQVADILKEKVKTYDLVLMLGQAAGRSKINLERCALNWLESRHPDESGQRPPPQILIPEAPRAYLNSLPLQDFVVALEKENIPAEVSFSAGAYVCNFAYFHVLHALALTSVKSLFVHVPLLPEQVKVGDSAPSMEFQKMFSAVQILLTKLIEESL